MSSSADIDFANTVDADLEDAFFVPTLLFFRVSTNIVDTTDTVTINNANTTNIFRFSADADVG